MIPKIIHFIYVGGRPFNFIHFLAIFTAKKVHQPTCIYFHHTEAPTGHWWEKAEPLLTLNRVEQVHQIHGNAIKYPAHMADVIRLEQLERHGGIYLDLDIISLNSFDPLLNREFVMGIEAGTGLCNAVIMTHSQSPFLKRWRNEYRNFDGDQWNYHSVILPWQLAREFPEQIHVADQYAFFYPTHNDPVKAYLWGQAPPLYELINRVARNILKLGLYKLHGVRDAVRLASARSFHALRGAHWHYQRARNSYCLHLWEGLWGEPYLKQVTPEYLRSSNSNFAKLLREVISDEELQVIAEPTIRFTTCKAA